MKMLYKALGLLFAYAFPLGLVIIDIFNKKASGDIFSRIGVLNSLVIGILIFIFLNNRIKKTDDKQLKIILTNVRNICMLIVLYYLSVNLENLSIKVSNIFLISLIGVSMGSFFEYLSFDKKNN